MFAQVALLSTDILSKLVKKSSPDNIPICHLHINTFDCSCRN